jgi:predicted PurR-regulated permease PerM
LTLNPVVIFLGLSFWGWLWGIPGALLAVPMLAMFKIFCDHIEPLAPIGEFLGN